MKANVIVTIHAVDALDADQLGRLTLLLTLTFKTGVAINTDKHLAEVRLVTSDVQALFRTVESLTVYLAQNVSSQLWVSVGTDWRDEG